MISYRMTFAEEIIGIEIVERREVPVVDSECLGSRRAGFLHQAFDIIAECEAACDTCVRSWETGRRSSVVVAASPSTGLDLSNVFHG